MSATRERTQSAREEKNVTEFVQATIAYEANVTFHAAAEATAHDAVLAKSVLLIGTAEQLADASVQALPFYSEAVAEAIKASVAGKILGTFSGGRRVAVGVVPATASRHNCAARPDVITALVRAALAEGSGAKELDVFTRSDAELPVTAAVARAATSPFTAKKGLAEKSYLPEAAKVRVFFGGALKTPAASLKIIADSVQLCQRLVEAPTNLVDTVTFAEIAAALGTKYGYGVEVIRGEALRERGYGGVYGVGKAAEFPPALVTLSYKPAGGIDPKKKIALVGKGIVYDTGGLAIKTPATGMCGMKRDMGGAAAVFAGFVAGVRLGVPHVLSCTLCLADNAIGPRSQRNDDIILMKSGLTVEINNTDAEGRLVLGDGVFHASAELDFTPDVIIDMATLTGAQGIATGKYHSGIYTNSGEWEERMVNAGRTCGDMCFPVVYAPEFHKAEFASKVADYRNSVANRSNAQVSCAASFIENNLSQSYEGAWVHVDCAAPVEIDGVATGYGPTLIATLLLQ